ncbi:hypothetical protein [Kibdelosporangium phytohabitans]|uniref:Uncharacterized protein n=1 Tax=Kibdelosporangium phytohabitans TaxID=860235 RepID=A0A0N9I462_9PSEU|nr:hypothetical protein [Kibdelosporangium phytohabitans]ALG12661.1 hypothetical protein AOZ06_42590 [Kibdelosporangium phytohabitans]MBE1464312.1 hypothetical protein [Kibdelosporangium phytohabitans]
MFFVYRSHYEGPLSKYVRRLPDESVLAWFQRNWHTADLEPELGVDPYGLDSIFDNAAKHGLPVPTSADDLREALHKHLYVEGGEDYVRLDEHSLRVRTDDDEVELAYYFFDDTVIAQSPERLAYLVHDQWPLPDTADAPARFTPSVPVLPAGQSGADDATTYAVLMTFSDGESLAITTPWEFPGVSLGNLAAHLRATEPNANWDPELLVLRELVEPGDDTIGPALERCNRWPGFNLNETPWPGLPWDHELTDGRDPGLSKIHVSDHLAHMAIHIDDTFGYQQWYLFDTTWAATHPDLAQSLLRYAGHWDPLERTD